MPNSKERIAPVLAKAAVFSALSALGPSFFAVPASNCVAQGETLATAAATRPVENSEAATETKAARRMPYEADLDKIDDVNPCIIKTVTITGNKLIPRSQIKALVKVKSGDFYNRSESEKDLRAIYSMGYFSGDDLHIDSEKTGFGMVLNIHVKENPLVKSFVFTGNKVLSNDQLLAAFKDQLQKPENKPQEKAAIKKILAEYHKQGYLLTTIKTDMGTIDEYGDDKNVGKVTVTVDEAIIGNIDIKCQNEEQKSIVQNALTIKVGDAYNENKLAADLRNAFKSGKFANLTRDVTRLDKNHTYQLTIESKPEEKGGAEAKAGARNPLLKPGKTNALPVLNKYIKSPMYKNIK
ncbi:MAG: hypothetical protein KGS72_13400 [Cyanobacteria bacterium REEB67]|nr:hypothetical protein [Cyanobacteria bacterium REEB67]